MGVQIVGPHKTIACGSNFYVAPSFIPLQDPVIDLGKKAQDVF